MSSFNNFAETITGSGAGTTRTNLFHLDAMDITIDSSSVTTGATINVQMQGADDDWYDLLDSTQEAITANGNKGPYHVPIGYEKFRVNCSAYTDGTHVVQVKCRKES